MIEADESDRSLLELWPQVAVLTNAELDHHSTYSSRLELDETFRTFMAAPASAPSSGTDPSWWRCARRARSPYDADAELFPGGSRFEWGGRTVELTVPGAHNAVNAAGALSAAALAGADPDARRGRAARLLGRAPAAELLGSHRGRRAGVRRLRPPPDRGRGGDRRRADARPAATGGRVPAAPVLAYAGAGDGVRRSARRRRRGRSCSTYTRRGSGPRISRAWTGGSSPRPRRTQRAGGRSRGCRGSTSAAVPRRTLREGDLCLTMGAGDVDALARSLVAGSTAARLAGTLLPCCDGDPPPGVQRDYPLARLTTIRTGGPAELFARAGTLAGARAAARVGGRRAARGRGRRLGVEPPGGGRRRPRTGPEAGQGAEQDRDRRERGSSAAAARGCRRSPRAPRRRVSTRDRVRGQHPGHGRAAPCG